MEHIYINEPTFFPGGNIGSLAIYGTVNNLAMRGAMPLALGLGVIIEEGFPLEDLEKIIIAVSKASKEAEVAVVAGDTKVAPQGKINGICLNTSGIGLVCEGTEISGAGVEEQDARIIGKVTASPMGRVRLHGKNGTPSFLEAL